MRRRLPHRRHRLRPEPGTACNSTRDAACSAAQCEAACDGGAIAFSRDYQMAASRRDDLVVRDAARRAAVALDEASRRLFGRSLKLRQVSAGGCNACEADTNVLGTVAWDLGRFGIQFVASPRHADGLLITGPVPENMRLALAEDLRGRPLAETGDRGRGTARFPAGRTSITPKSTTAWPPCCRSICSFPAVRRTR